MGAVGDRKGVGALGSMALDHALDILNVLKDIRQELRWLREQEQGKRHFELLYGGTAKAGTTLVLQPTEPIPQGYKFLPEHISAMAPPKSKLQLFENRIDASTLLEVVANIQEYANFTAGLIVEGPNVIVAVILTPETEGSVSIRVSGQLVQEIPSPEVRL
jgi:hypothetical protein